MFTFYTLLLPILVAILMSVAAKSNSMSQSNLDAAISKVQEADSWVDEIDLEDEEPGNAMSLRRALKKKKKKKKEEKEKKKKEKKPPKEAPPKECPSTGDFTACFSDNFIFTGGFFNAVLYSGYQNCAAFTVTGRNRRRKLIDNDNDKDNDVIIDTVGQPSSKPTFPPTSSSTKPTTEPKNESTKNQNMVGEVFGKVEYNSGLTGTMLAVEFTDFALDHALKLTLQVLEYPKGYLTYIPHGQNSSESLVNSSESLVAPGADLWASPEARRLLPKSKPKPDPKSKPKPKPESKSNHPPSAPVTIINSFNSLHCSSEMEDIKSCVITEKQFLESGLITITKYPKLINEPAYFARLVVSEDEPGKFIATVTVSAEDTVTSIYMDQIWAPLSTCLSLQTAGEVIKTELTFRFRLAALGL